MDFDILYAIQNNMNSDVLNVIMPAITELGNLGFIWIALGVALLISKRFRTWGIVLLLALLVTFVLGNLVLKPLVARPRPFLQDTTYQLLITPPSGWSFPSGHSSSSAAAATVVCFMPVKKRWKILVCALAVAIAFSRLYLFVHFPLDVACGIGLGVVCALCVVALTKRFFPDDFGA